MRAVPLLVTVLALGLRGLSRDASADPEKDLATWIERLGDEDAGKRDEAMARLGEAGEKARAALEAAARSEDAEVAGRAAALLRRLDRRRDGQLIFGTEPGRDEEGPMNLWTADLDGGRAEVLCEGQLPAASPDGRRVAYVTDLTAGRLVVRDLSSAREKRINSPSVGGMAAWDPGSRRLAFEADDGFGNSILSVEVDGEQRDDLDGKSAATGSFAFIPGWGLAGVRILNDFMGEDVPREYRLLGFRKESQPADLCELSVLPDPPAVAPDGSWLAVAARTHGGAIRVFRIHLRTGERTLLGDGVRALSGPSLSPDGTRLALVGVAEAAPDGSAAEIWEVVLATGRARKVAALDAGSVALRPLWRPDGAAVYTLLRGGELEDGQVVMTALADGGTRRVTPEDLVIVSLAVARGGSGD